MDRKEIWRSVPGFTGCFVSSFGRVWNRRRKKSEPTYGTTFNRGGYRHIHWVNDHGESLQPQVHRLVAAVFPDMVPNPGGKTEIDHIDGDPANNAVWNLRWVTTAENAANLVRMRRAGEVTLFKRVPKDCVGYLVNASVSFRTKAEIAKRYGCSTTTVDRIVNGRQKRNSFGIVSVTEIPKEERTLFSTTL